MARYIEADALLESVKSKRLIFEESTPVEEAIAEQVSVFEEAIMEAPTADVVPKSELERSQYLLKCAYKRVEELDKLCGELQKAKSEDAREIFEEIEREIKNHGITYALRKIAELKKKYTEAKKK